MSSGIVMTIAVMFIVCINTSSKYCLYCFLEIPSGILLLIQSADHGCTVGLYLSGQYVRHNMILCHHKTMDFVTYVLPGEGT